MVNKQLVLMQKSQQKKQPKNKTLTTPLPFFAAIELQLHGVQQII
jgi:hypothetical protein